MAKKGKKDLLETWSGSLHKSFRILPTTQFSNEDLLAFLNSEDGEHWTEVYARLPFDESRSRKVVDAGTPRQPDDKRYRDPRQVFEACGLVWEDDDQRIHLTEFGRSLKRFIPLANPRNVSLIAQHAALALNVCQLRSPTGAGKRYHPDINVFPFRFIWQAMLSLDGKINSDELNRAIFSTRNPQMLPAAIDAIRSYRTSGNVNDLGEETVEGDTASQKNNRIIPIVSLASFGWTLINYKVDGYYAIKPDCAVYLRAAVNVPVKHREYASVEEYVGRISRAACLPKDVR